MNIKEIKEMIDLMNKHNLSEFEVEKDGMKIRLKKQSGLAVPQIMEERIVVQPAASQAPKAPVAEVKEKKTVEIKAPMVGTFYRSPAPDVPPFVDIGHNVEQGQVICIIEAMKLMNEIKSDVKGKIVDITVENAAPVEFGQALFLIEPS